MDLSKPELTLGVLNATIMVSSIGYFYHRSSNIDKKLKELEEQFSEINDSMCEIEGNLDKLKKLNMKLNDFMDDVRSSFSRSGEDMKHIKNFIEYQQECMELISKQIKETNSSFELPEYQEPRRQNTRRRYNDEDDEFIQPARQRKQTTVRRGKRESEEVEEGRRIGTQY